MEKLYDTEVILKTHDNDKEFVKYIAGLFIEHAPEMSAELQKASLKKDWVNVHFYAHKMKASIDLFGIVKLKTLIREVEQNARHGKELENISEQVKYISETIEQCLTAMKEDFGLDENNLQKF